LARPAVRAVEAVRATDLAAWGTSEVGAPTTMPSVTAVSGSETVPSMEPARMAPATGRKGVDSASSAWSRAGTLSARSSTVVAMPNSSSARSEARKPNDDPSSR
jgi:hypothetical protein